MDGPEYVSFKGVCIEAEPTPSVAILTHKRTGGILIEIYFTTRSLKPDGLETFDKNSTCTDPAKSRDKLFEKLISLSRTYPVEQLTSEHKIS